MSISLDDDAEAASTLRSLVRDVLLPAYNDFDADASAACRESIRAEASRDGVFTSLAASGGARTPLAASGMRRKASQQRRVLRALLERTQAQAELAASKE